MNILILTSVPPYPLTSGGAQAEYNMIDVIRYYHNVTIMYPASSIHDRDSASKLRKIWPEVSVRLYPLWKQLANPVFLYKKTCRMINLKCRKNDRGFRISRILEKYGFEIDCLYRREVEKIVKESHIDLIQVEFYHYINCLTAFENIPKVFVQHEIRYMKNERLLSAFEPLTPKEKTKQKFYKADEISQMNHATAVITLTQTDKETLVRDGVKSPIFVSPAAISEKDAKYKPFERKFVFLGAYSNDPNQEGLKWLVKEVMPQLKDLEIPLYIIGKGWPDFVQEDLKFYYNDIHFMGFVENLNDVLTGSIMLVPILSGSGMRMKIIEAASGYSPFVSTTVGAEGLNFTDGVNCFVDDNPYMFAEKIKKLINGNLHQQFALNAHAIFEKYYSKKALGETRMETYDEIEKIIRRKNEI